MRPALHHHPKIYLDSPGLPPGLPPVLSPAGGKEEQELQMYRVSDHDHDLNHWSLN